MKIAVACDGLDVAPYFVQGTSYTFYLVDHGKVVGSRTLPALDKSIHEVANFFRSLETDALIVGRIEPKMAEVLRASGVDLVSGASGDPLLAVRQYLSNMFALAE